MDAGKFQLVGEADVILSDCGRFVPPVGSVVYIPHAFLLQAVLDVDANTVFYKEVTGDTTWVWRSISTALSGNPPLVYAQVLKPDGRFLFNGLMDLTPVAGFGSNRFLLTRELEVPPGSKIQLTLADHYPVVVAAAQPVSFLAEGAYAYYLKNGRRSGSVEQEASQMERITGTPNQNLLAPCWMSGNGPHTPPGFEDEQFIYGNGVSNVASVTFGGNVAAKCSIQIDNSEDFIVRRFLFDVTLAYPLGGTFTGRIRNGSGFAFTDDYIDLPRYLGGSCWAKGWHLKHGDQILFDLVAVDGNTGNTISIECFAEGVKRRRVA